MEKIVIHIRIENEYRARIVERELPYTGDFDNLKDIVTEVQLSLYDLGWSNELVERAVKETKVF
jgi:hypothetical protein